MGSEKKDLATKGAAAFALKIAGGVAAFGLTLVTTRTLGKEDSGIFFLALNIITILSAISRFGFDQTLTRFVGRSAEVKDWASINAVYRSVVPSVFLLSVCVAIATYFGSNLLATRVFQKPELAPVLHWMAWGICFLSVYWLHSHCFQGLRDIVRFQWFQNLGILCCFLAMIFAMRHIKGIGGISVVLYSRIYCFASAAIAVAALYSWRRNPWFQWASDKSRLRELLPIATQFLGVALLGRLVIWLPELVLGATREASEVSTYNCAFRTAQLISIGFLAVNSVTLPKLAGLFYRNELVRLREVMIHSTQMMVVISIPAVLIIVSCPRLLMSIFGGEFEDGVSVLRVLAFGQFINVITGSVGGLLDMTGHQRLTLWGNVLAVTLIAILSFILIPRYGMLGAGISQAIALSVQNLYFTWAVRKQFGFIPLTFRRRL